MIKITNNVKLIETDSKFLEKVSAMIDLDGEIWYHMPFWYRKIAENVYEEVRFTDLPKNLQDRVRSFRDNLVVID
jgi:hypothetical protein